MTLKNSVTNNLYTIIRRNFSRLMFEFYMDLVDSFYKFHDV